MYLSHKPIHQQMFDRDIKLAKDSRMQDLRVTKKTNGTMFYHAVYKNHA